MPIEAAAAAKTKGVVNLLLTLLLLLGRLALQRLPLPRTPYPSLGGSPSEEIEDLKAAVGLEEEV